MTRNREASFDKIEGSRNTRIGFHAPAACLRSSSIGVLHARRLSYKYWPRESTTDIAICFFICL